MGSRSSRSRSRSRSWSRSRRGKRKKIFDAEAVSNVLKTVNQMKGMTPEQLAMLASSSNGSSSINMAEILGSADGNPQEIKMMLAQAANPQLTQQARKLYVGNLPVGIAINEQMLTEFFNSTVTRLGITTPNPVLSSWRSSEGTFCFVEFRSVQDTTTFKPPS